MRCSCIQTDNIQSGLLPLRPILSDPINHCPIRPNPIQHAKHFLIRIWSYPYYHMSSHPARSEPIRLATEPYSSAFAIECGYTAPYIVQAQMKKHILAHVLSRPQLWWHPPPQPKAEVEPSTRTTMRKITTIMITTAITIRANTITRNTILATCTVHTDTHTQNHKHTVQSPQYTICNLISRCKNELKQRETTATTAKWEKNKHSQQKHLSIKQPEKNSEQHRKWTNSTRLHETQKQLWHTTPLTDAAVIVTENEMKKHNCIEQQVVQEPTCRNTTKPFIQKQQQTDEKEIVKHIIGITNKP